MVFSSTGHEAGIDAVYLSNFLRQFASLNIYSSQALNVNSFEYGRLFEHVDVSADELDDAASEVAHLISESINSLGLAVGQGVLPYITNDDIRLTLDNLLRDLLSRYHLLEGAGRSPSGFPVIESMTYNSPLTIRIAGLTKVMLLAVIVCGGKIDTNYGKAELPDLIDTVERVNTILIQHLSNNGKSMGPKDILSQHEIESLLDGVEDGDVITEE